MGASKKIRMILLDKDKTTRGFAGEIGMLPQTLYNKLQRDTMGYKEVERLAEALGCEIVFKDKETGKEY